MSYLTDEVNWTNKRQKISEIRDCPGSGAKDTTVQESAYEFADRIQTTMEDSRVSHAADDLREEKTNTPAIMRFRDS